MSKIYLQNELKKFVIVSSNDSLRVAFKIQDNERTYIMGDSSSFLSLLGSSSLFEDEKLLVNMSKNFIFKQGKTFDMSNSYGGYFSIELSKYCPNNIFYCFSLSREIHYNIGANIFINSAHNVNTYYYNLEASKSVCSVFNDSDINILKIDLNFETLEIIKSVVCTDSLPILIICKVGHLDYQDIPLKLFLMKSGYKCINFLKEFIIGCPKIKLEYFLSTFKEAGAILEENNFLLLEENV